MWTWMSERDTLGRPYVVAGDTGVDRLSWSTDQLASMAPADTMTNLTSIAHSLREVNDTLNELPDAPRPEPTVQELLAAANELENLLMRGTSQACQSVNAQAWRLSQSTELRHDDGGDPAETIKAAMVLLSQVADNSTQLALLVRSAHALLSHLHPADSVRDTVD